jgi:hypothetical protein
LAGGFALFGRELSDVMVIVVGVEDGKKLIRRLGLGERGGGEKSESECEFKTKSH